MQYLPHYDKAYNDFSGSSIRAAFTTESIAKFLKRWRGVALASWPEIYWIPF